MISDNQSDIRTNSDSEKFIRLYRSHYDAVFRYCAHRLFDRNAAEDVTSQVFLKAVENFGRFNGDQRQFHNWLYKIATNTINNYLRKIVRRNGYLKYIGQYTDNRDTDDSVSVETIALLKKAMLSLKPHYQTVITLRFFENMKIAEIAKLTGSSPGTVRSQLSRALTKLRKVLATEKSEVNENER